jgi:hypothetical protein
MELSHSPGHDDHHASTRPCLSRTRPCVIVLRVLLAGAFQITCSARMGPPLVAAFRSSVALFNLISVAEFYGKNGRFNMI